MILLDMVLIKKIIMKIKTLKSIKVITFLSIFLLLGACAKNSIVYEYNGEDNQTSGNSEQGNNTLVTFYASIESRNMTRAMSPMKKGIQNRLFAYTQSGNSTSLSAQGLYITSSPGILSGNNDYKMYLSNGIYNFYAVSDNFSTIPPTFSGGESEPLFNGIDYLWWKASQQDVTSSQINIPIVYQHAATQVVIKVSAGENIELNQLVAATITPPNTGASMNLFTGIIPPTSIYGKPDKMGIN